MSYCLSGTGSLLSCNSYMLLILLSNTLAVPFPPHSVVEKTWGGARAVGVQSAVIIRLVDATCISSLWLCNKLPQSEWLEDMLVSYTSEGQKSKMDVTGLKPKCWQSWIPSGSFRETSLSLFPASRCRLPLLGPGPVLRLQRAPQLCFHCPGPADLDPLASLL